MNDLLIGLLSAALATNQPAALSNLVLKKTGVSVNVPAKNDPLEKEFQKLMDDDDAAHAEVDQWILDSQKKAADGDTTASITLRPRIRQRLELVRKAYEDFLQRHPGHARARLAYGSFLSGIQEEEEAQVQWEKARELDPKNPAVWNNLANWYGHNSPVAKAFEYYAKAIELDPTEAVYYQNLATTVFLFRRDATNYYKITEAQVFDRALALYRKALELDPENFLLATDLAQSYYGIPAPKAAAAAQKFADDALAAWQAALKVAGDDKEREGVYIHFARVQINASRFDDARKNLSVVTNQVFDAVKQRLLKKLANEEAKAKGTNTPAATLKAPPK